MNNEYRTLPSEFAEHMRVLLGNEYDEFEKNLYKNRSYGIRINPLKIDIDMCESLRDRWGIVSPVPWSLEGYYYDETVRPGKSPYHEAGAYYIQEPSAMSVVQVLDPKPGEVICDMCAAPGGKTTHIAGRMKGLGTLICNEYVTERSRILSRNVERMGISNCCVLNESPETLAAHFTGFFDKIVVDAPCSGEGMFRKEEAAISEWSLDNVQMCAERQMYILENAAQMLKNGGVLVYSTCTFEPSEDEQIIYDFLVKNRDWELIETGLDVYLEHGRPEWISVSEEDNTEGRIRDSLIKTNRIWPHKQSGEGHFIAKLRKKGDIAPSINAKIKNSDRTIAKKTKEFLHTELFLSDDFVDLIDENRILNNKDHIYLRPMYLSDYNLKGVRIVRSGLELVTINNNRMEPAHALAMALRPENLKYSCCLNEEDANKYIHGETIAVDYDIPSGKWVLVTLNGISLGWGKYVNGIIKNHYPKGLRTQY